jgi:hypothetical protein
MITLNSASSNFEIDEYKINKYENVKTYNFMICSPELHIYLSDDINDTNSKDYYYIFDCPGEDAFAHFVYESFIFYPIFQKIANIHPSIKILTTINKNFVKNLFKFFNIKNEIINKIENINNICFFSPIMSLNDHNINQEFYIKHINLFSNYITNNISLFDQQNILFLPRNTKENYLPNDRIIYGTDDIKENIVKIGGTIIDTYEINDIGLQFSKINSFNTIILDFGSSFLVNCIFLKNKKILVLDNYGYSYQINNFISINIIYNIIKNNNTIYFIKPKINNTILFNDIYEYL